MGWREKIEPSEVLRVGTVLYGYCGGTFGDTFADKRVEAIGYDWVVVRAIDGNRDVYFYEGNPECLLHFTQPEDDS